MLISATQLFVYMLIRHCVHLLKIVLYNTFDQ